MPYVGYDTTRNGAIKGLFTKQEIAKRRSENFLEVTAQQFESVKLDPNNYHVVENKLEPVSKTFTNFIKTKSIQEQKRNTARSITEVLEVGGYAYRPDSAFQQNLSLNLGIVAVDKDHVTRLWCTKNNDWEFRQHSKSELIEIAKQFNLLRERMSQELYKNL